MQIDELISKLKEVSSDSASDALASLDRALADQLEMSQETLIVAAYIAGLEDGITALAGRPEYDLRRLELTERSERTLGERGRAIAQGCMDDLIAEAQGG